MTWMLKAIIYRSTARVWSTRHEAFKKKPSQGMFSEMPALDTQNFNFHRPNTK